jgi:hypothetical protein
VNWKIKKQVLSFLVKTRSLKEYDELTPHRVGFKAVQLIENIIEAKSKTDEVLITEMPSKD